MLFQAKLTRALQAQLLLMQLPIVIQTSVIVYFYLIAQGLTQPIPAFIIYNSAFSLKIQIRKYMMLMFGLQLMV
ncbi:MAG: hypothetical protein EBS73_16175 [Betaproteobacteria bacterium]|nr:hypothetical protein [Betaproteobacteria bacterium]